METPKKLTKAEAGRLGGLRTKEKHGTEHYRRAGAKGAKAVLDRFGKDHMAAIGKKGFAALARRITCMRRRKAAVQLLQAMGRIATPPRPQPVNEPFEHDGPDDDPEEENPVVAHVLASIRSAPIPPDGGL